MGDLVRIEEKQIIEAIANMYNVGTDGVSIYSDYEFIRRGDDKVRRDFVYAIIDKRVKPFAEARAAEGGTQWRMTSWCG